MNHDNPPTDWDTAFDALLNAAIQLHAAGRPGGQGFVPRRCAYALIYAEARMTNAILDACNQYDPSRIVSPAEKLNHATLAYAIWAYTESLCRKDRVAHSACLLHAVFVMAWTSIDAVCSREIERLAPSMN